MLAGVAVVAVLGAVGWQAVEGLTIREPEVVAVESIEEPMLLAQAGLGTPVVMPALQVQETDRVLGDPNAPVTLIEYASMTCSHCGNFHNNFLPDIEKAYISTGKVKLVMRDLPWDNMALGISKVARCVPKDQFYMLVKAFFRSQDSWLKSMDPLGEIKKIARFAGMDGATVDRCVKDADLHEEVLASKTMATDVLNVKGTPTFFINGERVQGLRNFGDLTDALDAALMQAQQRG